MIENELQYNTTKQQVKKFEEAIDNFHVPTEEGTVNNEIMALMKQALESQLETLRQEVKEWESKK